MPDLDDRSRPAAGAARRDVLVAVAASRGLVLVVAVLAAQLVSVTRSPEAPGGKLVPGISHPFGEGGLAGVLDALFTPLLRWDALWYLQISRDGYQPLGLVADNTGQRPAFFPLYPLLVQALGGWSGDGARVIVATLISLGAFVIGLTVVHRLTTIELGPTAARGAVLCIAFWPGPFFSAPYTESLFLALSAGAFLAARTDRWWLAGLLGAAAAATRNTGFLLLVPLVVLYLYGPRGRPPDEPSAQRWWSPRFRPRRDVLWLAVIPVGLVAYSVFLQLSIGDWQAWRNAQASFGRPGLASPVTTVHLALTGAYHAVRDTLAGGGTSNVLDPVGVGTGGSNLLNLGVLGLLVVSAVGVSRRLPAAYAVWVVVAVGPALLTPFDGDALRSLPRFVSVLFPVAMWLGYKLRRRALVGALLLGGVLLVGTTVAFTIWLPFV